MSRTRLLGAERYAPAIRRQHLGLPGIRALLLLDGLSRSHFRRELDSLVGYDRPYGWTAHAVRPGLRDFQELALRNTGGETVVQRNLAQIQRVQTPGRSPMLPTVLRGREGNPADVRNIGNPVFRV